MLWKVSQAEIGHVKTKLKRARAMREDINCRLYDAH